MAKIHDNPLRQPAPLPISHSNVEPTDLSQSNRQQPASEAQFNDPEIKQPANPDNDGIYDGEFFA